MTEKLPMRGGIRPRVTTSTVLYACLHVRGFPLQALLRQRTELQAGLRKNPMVVLEGEPPFEQVCSANRRARALGLVRGSTRVETELFPQALVLARSPTEESAAKTALLECAGRFSPRIEDRSRDGEFTVVLDITGAERLFGVPQELGVKLLKSVELLGIRAGAAISSNFHAAVCLARGMASSPDVLVVARLMEKLALEPLPLSVLGLLPEHAETFSSWGIATLGALANLPETELIVRLGQEGKRLRQLARGELPHLFSSLKSASYVIFEKARLESRAGVRTVLFSSGEV